MTTKLRFLWSIAALLLTAVAVAALGFMYAQDSEPQRASAASGGATEMVLTLPSHNNCDDPDRPTICTLAAGTTFTISVELLNPPPIGYVLAQAWIDYDDHGLVHKKNTQATWPDCVPNSYSTIDDIANNGAQAGCTTTSIVDPSFYSGRLYIFEFTCSNSPSTSTVRQIGRGVLPPAGENGSEIHELNNPWHRGSQFVPKLSGDLTIECLGLPEPGDTDGDSCSDQQEFGSDETLGGQRDYLNPNDFYDVLGEGGGPGDGVIDLANDVLGVILRFSPGGLPPYDVNFDRGPSSGPNAWNMTAPDGGIDLANDILGVILQFGHDCR